MTFLTANVKGKIEKSGQTKAQMIGVHVILVSPGEEEITLVCALLYRCDFTLNEEGPFIGFAEDIPP